MVDELVSASRKIQESENEMNDRMKSASQTANQVKYEILKNRLHDARIAVDGIVESLSNRIK